MKIIYESVALMIKKLDGLFKKNYNTFEQNALRTMFANLVSIRERWFFTTKWRTH